MSTLRPADICRRFHISRTTLFRWEEKGLIPVPKRDGRGTRVYEARHTTKIANLLRKQLVAKTKNVGENEEMKANLKEEAYRIDFLSSKRSRADKLRQLRTVATRQGLSQRTIDSLVEEAAALPRGHPVRAEIWRILAIDDDRAKKAPRKPNRKGNHGRQPVGAK